MKLFLALFIYLIIFGLATSSMRALHHMIVLLQFAQHLKTSIPCGHHQISLIHFYHEMVIIHAYLSVLCLKPTAEIHF